MTLKRIGVKKTDRFSASNETKGNVNVKIIGV